ncbi:MAG: hybrid sensor histidine kinase/response regulator [Vicinamibacterales bacterium]
MPRDRFRYFRVEARELLEHLGQSVLDLEKGTPSPDLVARLLRLAHTLKGAARVVKQQEIADQAHAVEDALAALREPGTSVSRDQIDRLLERLDDIGQRVAMLTPPSESGSDRGPGSSEELFRAFRPEMHEMDGLLDTIAEAQSQLTALRPLVNRLGRARHLADLVLDHFAAPGVSDVRPGDRTTSQKARSLAEDFRATVGTLEGDFTSRVDHISREFREARSAAERLRLVPATALFTVLERTARDTAQALSKRVVFEGRGGDVRLDAHVLAIAQGALLQLVRNAVAHGVEPAAERTAAGKTPAGRVILDVLRRGQRVVFSCRDDGRGIDLEAVRRLAHLKGLAPGATEALRPEDVVDLLLKGGLSTSRTVTDVSGRGVGLDVVREAAERLGGEVTVRTDPREGTTVELIVPITLASFPGLLVDALGVTAILPLDAVRETLRLAPEAVIQTAQGQFIVHDGQNTPLRSLALALVHDPSPARTPGPSTVVVVAGRTASAAFSVDRILGIATVVLRPLPDLAPAAPFVVGASIDPEGSPQLVLDPDALVSAVDGMRSGVRDSEMSRPAVLVIDDSLTTRMLEQSILESAGYVVDLAVSGEDALKKAREVSYALFLVDVEMPGMDGFTFVEHVRAEPALRDIPSILVTSRSAPDDQRRGAEVGAQAYMIKGDFDQGVLLEHIRRLVG